VNDEVKVAGPRLAQYRMGIVFTGSNVLTWSIALGTPMILLGEHLGATTAQIGLLYSFVFVLSPLQILAIGLIPRFGYKRLAILSWGARSSLLLIPAWVALRARDGNSGGLLLAFMLSLFGVCFIRTLGMATVFPWVMEWVPSSLRSRYYSTDTAALSFVAVLSLLISSVALKVLEPELAYSVLYGLAFIGGVASTYSLIRIPDVPVQDEAVPMVDILRQSLRICTDRSPLRFYLCFHFLFGICHFAYPPFTTYYLQVETDMTDSAILFLSVVSCVAMTVASLLLQKWMAQIGTHNGFRLWSLAFVLLSGYWLLILLGADWLLDYLFVGYAINGIAVACFLCAHMKYLAQLSDGGSRALVLSVFGALTGVFGGLTPIFWGWILKGEGMESRINHSAFAVFFGLMFVIFLVLPALIRRFDPVSDERPLIFNPVVILRPNRWFVSFVRTRELRKD
jgi:MFS family permease